MPEPIRKIVENGELGKSLIMPDVTIKVPMPRGAAIPAREPSMPSQGQGTGANGGQSGQK